jgi:hypothetical protein
MIDGQAPPNRGGRPQGSTTGQAKMRTARIGPLWDRGQELAAALAERDGARTNMTAYVEEALRRENARVERLLARQTAAVENTDEAE